MILIVDDEDNFVSSYKEILEDHGYDVQIVLSVDQGMEEIRANYASLELLIIDIMIPGDSAELKGQDTNGGKRSGERLIEAVLRWEQEQKKENLVPKLIFTNVVDADFHKRWSESASVENVLEKQETGILEFLGAVESCIRKRSIG